MILKYPLFLVIFNLLCQSETYIAEKITYIATERPVVVFYNKVFLKNVTVNSRRYSRKDPRYYINVHVETLMTMGNNAMFNFYFFELKANRYFRTFVEMHFRGCDFKKPNTIFGHSVVKAFSNSTCPFKPGQYILSNLTIPLRSIPETFPYKQGRLLCNVSADHDGSNTRIAEAYIDLAVRMARIRNDVP